VSARGIARSTLKVDEAIAPGTLFMSFHWGQEFREDGCVNALTTGASDPISKQSELKFSAVRLEKDQ
jgi:assimilatory nitrate reductase catalytic subunit